MGAAAGKGSRVEPLEPPRSFDVLDREDGLAAAARAPPPSNGCADGADTSADGVLSHTRSIVKLFVVECARSYHIPWQMEDQLECSGTGFLLRAGGGAMRVLTNAHVVAFAVSVRACRFGESRKFVARVVAISHESDLALLEVADAGFWAARGGDGAARGGGDDAVALDERTPRITDETYVLGFPSGGENISVTKGVVSRIDMQRYSGHKSCPKLLVIQIDAAINPGNSGGPVFNRGGLVVGVAFCKDADGESDNIGYIIPTTVVQCFLDEVAAHGTFRGVCGLGFVFQTMENDVLRRAMRLPDDRAGVLVTRVGPLAPFAASLRPRDVLLAIDGRAIAADATVALARGREGDRVPFEHLVTSRPPGAAVALTLWRDGAACDARAACGAVPRLVPLFDGADAANSYFIVGGLQFAPLSMPLFESMEASETSAIMVEIERMAFFSDKRTPRQQVLVLQRVLIDDELTFGYHHLAPAIVASLNGEPLEDLGALVRAVDAFGGEFLDFVFTNHASIILDAAACRRREHEILQRNAIPARLSADMQPYAARDGVLAAAGRACGCSRRPDASDPAEVAAPTFTDEPAVS